MAKRRYTTRYARFARRSRRIGRGLGASLKGGAIGNGFKGVGAGWAGEQVAGAVAPQYADIGGFVGSYFGGGIPGVIGHGIRKVLEGTLNLGSFNLGGGSSSRGESV
jgi:hypothetical protein